MKKTIISVLLCTCIIASMTGCGKISLDKVVDNASKTAAKAENKYIDAQIAAHPESYKMFCAVTGDNEQGVKEALQHKEKLNLEKLVLGDDTSFLVDGSIDKRALALALEPYAYVNYRIISMLIKAGADVNSTPETTGVTYLMESTSDVTLCRMLLDAGAKVNVTDKEDGYTALDYAVQDVTPQSKANYEKVKQMLEAHGAKVTKKTLHACIDNDGYLIAGSLLKELKQNGEDTGISKALEYAIEGYDSGLQERIKAHDIPKSEKTQVIYYAAANCNAHTLQLLHENGYIYQHSNDDNILPLAARYNNTDSVKELLKLGAKKTAVSDDSIQDSDGHNALTGAVIGGKAETVSLLLKKGLTWQKKTEMDTWVEGCNYGNAESVSIMIKAGYKPTKEEILGGYEYSNQKTFQTLQKCNIPFIESYQGKNVYGEMSPDIIEKIYLMNNRKIGANAFSQYLYYSPNQSMALDMAKHCTNLNKENESGYFPLELAVDFGQTELVKTLIANGADMNQEINDEDGSIMNLAAASPSTEILQYLIDHGGKANAKGKNGKTPLQSAEEIGLKDNVELLKKAN